MRSVPKAGTSPAPLTARTSASKRPTRRVWLDLGLGAAAVVLASGCAGGGPTFAPDAPVDTSPPNDGGPCQLAIASINGRAAVGQVERLGPEDDQDVGTTGLQIEVAVTGENLADGTRVRLSVTRLASSPVARAAGGRASFEVTVTAGLTEVLLQAHASDCLPSERRLPVEPAPECFFIVPADGAALSADDDLDPDNTTFDYDVLVGTTDAAEATIELKAGPSAPAAKQVDAAGQAFFPGRALEIGDQVVLTGRVTRGGVERTCTATISVTSSRPSCSVRITPATVGTSAGLGGVGVAHDADLVQPGMQANIEVLTGLLVNRVTLRVEGSRVDASSSHTVTTTTAATAGRAHFTGFPLPEGEVELEAICAETASGNVGSSPVTRLFVDSYAPETPDDFDCEVIDRRAGKVACCWTAADDTGSGVAFYDLRYAIGMPLTAANWDIGTKVQTIPAAASSAPLCATTSVPLGEDYDFALRAVDLVDNGSEAAHPPDAPLTVDLARQLRAGTNADSAWGERVTAGDFNGDGHTDLAVGDPGHGGGRGRVAIYLGHLNGYPRQPTKFFVGTVDGGQLGAGVATLPAFDGQDGYADLAVVAAHGDTSAARVYIYLGRPVPLQRTDVVAGSGAEAVYTLAGGPGAPGGRIVGATSAGDFDGDGASDLAIAYRDDLGDTAELWIVHGDAALAPMVQGTLQLPTSTAVPTGAGVRLLGGKASDDFGGALCGGASLDGDNFADLLISASATEQSSQPRGAVHVLRGAGRAAILPENLSLSGPRVNTIAGDTENTSFGEAVAVVGDINGDGTIEFAASDSTVDADGGAVYLFRFGAGAPASAADAVATIRNTLSGVTAPRLGIGLACVAETTGVDLNQDGRADLLVGAESLPGGPGGVLRLDGASPMPTLDVSSPGFVYLAPPDSGYLGPLITVAKDIDQDGFPDLILGDPSHDGGRGRVVVIF